MAAKKNVERRGVRRRRGQGMTEYIVLVGLIAILLIGAVRVFSNSLKNAINTSTRKINNDITKQIDKNAKVDDPKDDAGN